MTEIKQQDDNKKWAGWYWAVFLFLVAQVLFFYWLTRYFA